MVKVISRLFMSQHFAGKSQQRFWQHPARFMVGLSYHDHCRLRRHDTENFYRHVHRRTVCSRRCSNYCSSSSGHCQQLFHVLLAHAGARIISAVHLLIYVLTNLYAAIWLQCGRYRFHKKIDHERTRKNKIFRRAASYRSNEEEFYRLLQDERGRRIRIMLTARITNFYRVQSLNQ